MMTLFTQTPLAAGIALTVPKNVPAPVHPAATYPPVAVPELFTSQGCSSCPSADRLLSEVARANKQIIGLSFHVDYWDRLGWEGPFSDHAFTQRQYAYGQHFRQQGVYTPQEVLNGQQEFVGLNCAKQSSVLAEALGKPATAAVTLTANASKQGQLTVQYQLAGDLTDAVLNVALVSKTIQTEVRRGENSGRKLTHDNVVRVFQTVPAAASGTLTIKLPANFDRANGAVVAYVQARQTLAIRGAGQVSL